MGLCLYGSCWEPDPDSEGSIGGQRWAYGKPRPLERPWPPQGGVEEVRCDDLRVPSRPVLLLDERNELVVDPRPGGEEEAGP